MYHTMLAEATTLFFLVGRLLFGGFFIMSGANHFMQQEGSKQYAASKGVPSPEMMVPLTGVMMIAGGAGILLGVYIQLSVALLVIFLLTAAFKMHDFWTVADPMQKMIQMLLFMRNLALTGAALMLLAIPQPWEYSLW